MNTNCSARKSRSINFHQTGKNEIDTTIRVTQNLKLNIPEFVSGKIKKKFNESPTREFTVSELIAQTGSPC